MKKILVVFVFTYIFLISEAFAQTSNAPSLSITLLNYQPSPARAGETIDLRLRVENNGGGAIENLEIETPDNYPFSAASEEAIKEIGTLQAYQNGDNFVNAEFTLKVDKEAINGQHELKVRYRYNNQEWVTSAFNIQITSKEFAQIVYLDKAKLQPGKETEMCGVE